MARAVQDVHKALTMKSMGVSPVIAVATAGVSVAEGIGPPVADLPLGCEAPLAKGGGPEDAAW